MSKYRIAIVGMACRYPDATTPEELWQNVLAGRRAFRRIPESRLPSTYRGTAGQRADPDLSYATHAAVLRDWTFDRERFGVPGPLYRAADQTHWLALETAATALADAGFTNADGLDTDTAGVVLGNSLTGEFSRASMLRLRWPFIADAAATALADAGLAPDLARDVLTLMRENVKQPFPVPGDETLAGALANTIAGRICNHFDFHGTGYTVDGACSSSLLAVMTACRALVSEECDFMLAGGVDMSLDPLELVGFSRLGALATDDMRVYDAEPSGFLPGEGCGVLALMRAEDAEARGLRSYAHIIGWASSSDGSGGLTRPETSGQAMALRRAYRMAQVPPDAAQLIEGHGTGTAIGDRVEIEALTEVRGSAAERAALGSIKANIGHTKAAAGVASLIKAALATHHRVLPPATGSRRPHPLLAEGAPLRLLSEPEPWRGQTPRAGVSSMGFGGINTHIVVEGTGPAAPSLPAAVRRWSTTTGQDEIVVLGATSAQELAQRLTHLADTAAQLSTAEVRDVAATAWQQRGNTAPYRAAIVARTPDELARSARAAGESARDWSGSLTIDRRAGYVLASGSALRVGVLLPGQAAPVRWALPWWTRRLDLPELPAELTRRGESVATELAQPAIVRQSLAALAWLTELGCHPIAACGHSLGEITALAWAGALSPADALRLAQARGAVMAEHGTSGTTMASITARAAEVEQLLAGTEAVIACFNGPRQIVVSGPQAGIAEVISRAASAGIPASGLAVSHGFHSDAMLPVAGPLADALADIPFSTPAAGLISTITGGPTTAADDHRKLLIDQLTAPVRFADAVRTVAQRCDLLIEAGPGAILTGLADATVPDVQALSMDSGGDERSHTFVTAVLGVAVCADLDPWFIDRPHRTLQPDAVPRFVTSPCENRAGWSTAPELSPVNDANTPPQATRTTSTSTPDDPLAALTAHLAGLLELPADSLTPERSLLGDLHMTSLQVVDAVSAVAGALGKQLPSAPLTLSDATIGEAAGVIGELPSTDATPAATQAAGVRGWVRQFAAQWVPLRPGHTARTGIEWEVVAPDEHWLHELPTEQGQPGLAVALDRTAGISEIAALLARIGATTPRHLLVVHDAHPAAAGIARSVSSELPECRVVVVDQSCCPVPVDALLGEHPSRYLELRSRPDGLERAVVSARPALPAGGALPDLPGVCLVTGGVRGITAYAALELAERTGCTLVFTGRSPVSDPAVTAALRDMSGRASVQYISCDVSDKASATALVAQARKLGPICGLVHGAGVNEPRTLGEVTAESLERTVAPKVIGLRTMLDALGDDDLLLLLGFGSIIGRQGLAGQAEYCIANDWLRVEIETWAQDHPRCRTHLLEWSVWSGAGMGVRLGVLDTLRRQGVEPIGPRQGVAALCDLLAEPDAPVSVLLTARFPATPTLTIETAGADLLRFCEHVQARTPGVEAVAAAELSLGSDPYLDDHRIDGVPVLPAVLALEAMTQVAGMANGEPPNAVTFSDVEFRAPVTVSGNDQRTVQVAALVEAHGVDVVLRDESDQFSVDRFAGTVHTADTPPPTVDAAQPPSGTPDPHPFYGSTFFHTGRFQRLLGYDLLTAFQVRAWIQAGEDDGWFSPFHSGELLLGDPGAHDAALHILLACVPHRRALPVGVRRLSVWRKPSGPLRVLATEVAHTVDEYTYDVDVVEADGTPVARWAGLRLRAINSPSHRVELPKTLVGPWLSRRLIECGFADGIELVAAGGNRTAGSAAQLVQLVTSQPASHDPAGALQVDGYYVSASYAADDVLLAVAKRPLGVDWEPVGGSGTVIASGDADAATAQALAAKLGEGTGYATLRVWTAREALVKLGHEQTHPLRVDQITEDGIAVLCCGDVHVVTAKVHVCDTQGQPGRVIALAYEQDR